MECLISLRNIGETSTLRGITLMVDVKITQNILAQREITLEDYLTTQWTFPVGSCPFRFS